MTHCGSEFMGINFYSCAITQYPWQFHFRIGIGERAVNSPSDCQSFYLNSIDKRTEDINANGRTFVYQKAVILITRPHELSGAFKV